MEAGEVLLSARGLSRAVGSRRLWQDVELAVSVGERLGISGPSGVGKSLLLRALAGLDALQSGEVWLRGKSQSSWPMPQFRAEVMSLLQRPAPASGTVGAHLAEPFGFKVHAGKRHQPEEAARLLNQLGRPPTFLDQDAAHLSGGEAQLVALVRALLLSPTVLLLDEATSALDADTAERAESVLRAWLADGPARALIFVSHDRAQQARFATRVHSLSGVGA